MIDLRYCFVFLLALLSYDIVEGQSWEQARQTGAATLDLHWYVSRPFIYRNDEQEFIGLEKDILEAFRDYVWQKHNVNLTLNWMENESFAGILDDISRSEVPNQLGISAFSITEERKEMVQYTRPYMPDVTVLVSSQGTPIVRSIEDIDDLMSGMTAITIAGTVYEKQLTNLKEKLHIDFKTVYIESDENVLEFISQTPNSFGFIDLPIYLMWIKNGSQLVRQNYFTVFGTGYGFIMPLESDWSLALDEFLSDPASKSLINGIISKHISKELFEFISNLYEGDLLGTSLLTKEKEIQLALIENANLRLQREQTYKLFLIGGISISSLFLVIIGFAFLQIRRNNKLLLSRKEQIEHQQADIQQKNEQLINRNAKLIALNEEKNYLVRILAHDLRSPLSRIIGLSGVLASHSDLDDQEYKDHLANIGDAAQRMNQMINKILSQDALAGEQHQLIKERVVIGHLLEDISKRYNSVASSKQIELITTPCDYHNYLETDFLLLQLILENLVSNAIKFSSPGTQVRLETICSEEDVKFCVIDQGPGFTEEDKANLYSRFQPLSAQPTGDESSTGLGLSIVKKYVTELGGKVWLESEPGKGSTFYVWFSKEGQ